MNEMIVALPACRTQVPLAPPPIENSGKDDVDSEKFAKKFLDDLDCSYKS